MNTAFWVYLNDELVFWEKIDTKKMQSWWLFFPFIFTRKKNSSEKILIFQIVNYSKRKDIIEII